MLLAIMLLVFHRILDKKAGLDFYPGPFLLGPGPDARNDYRLPAVFVKALFWTSISIVFWCKIAQNNENTSETHWVQPYETFSYPIRLL